MEDAAACIDHIVKVAGIDHVGIGTDFDGIKTVPIGLEDVSKMPALTDALLRRGYKEDDIRCRRLGRLPEARASYEKALALLRQEPERRFLAGRLRELK